MVTCNGTLPEFGGVLGLDGAPISDKVSISFQKVDSFLCVGGQVIVLVLQTKKTLNYTQIMR